MEYFFNWINGFYVSHYKKYYSYAFYNAMLVNRLIKLKKKKKKDYISLRKKQETHTVLPEKKKNNNNKH